VPAGFQSLLPRRRVLGLVLASLRAADYLPAATVFDVAEATL
jgi:hypothetical protein